MVYGVIKQKNFLSICNLVKFSNNRVIEKLLK